MGLCVPGPLEVNTSLRNAHQGQDGGRLVLASHKSVRDHHLFLPETQVVPQDLIKSQLSIRSMQALRGACEPSGLATVPFSVDPHSVKSVN